MATPALTPKTGAIHIKLFDGSGGRFKPTKNDVLFTVHGGRSGRVHRLMKRTGDLLISELPLDSGADTNYAVVASTKGWFGAGYFPVKASEGKITEIELMLVPKRHELNFSGATWKDLRKSEKQLAEFFGFSGTGAAFAFSAPAKSVRISGSEIPRSPVWVAQFLSQGGKKSGCSIVQCV